MSVAAFMQAFDKQSLSVPYHLIRNDAYVLSNMQLYVHDFHLTTKEFHKFYETFEKYFELIAQTIHSKLNNI